MSKLGYMLTLVISLMLTVAPAQLSHAAGFPVRCESLEQQYGPSYANDLGAADLQKRMIVLQPGICRGFWQDPQRRTEALVTLGHERAHLLGVMDEHAADCKGILDAPWLAKRIGIRFRRVWVRLYANLRCG